MTYSMSTEGVIGFGLANEIDSIQNSINYMLK